MRIYIYIFTPNQPNTSCLVNCSHSQLSGTPGTEPSEAVKRAEMFNTVHEAT